MREGGSRTRTDSATPWEAPISHRLLGGASFAGPGLSPATACPRCVPAQTSGLGHGLGHLAALALQTGVTAWLSTASALTSRELRFYSRALKPRATIQMRAAGAAWGLGPPPHSHHRGSCQAPGPAAHLPHPLPPHLATGVFVHVNNAFVPQMNKKNAF